MKTVEELLSINKISTSILHKDLTRTSFIIGACHDIGKGTPYFQRYILHNGEKIDVFLKSHAQIGALYCSWLILNDKEISEDNKKFLALAASLVIQGHHGSLKSRDKYVINLDYFNESKIFLKQIESYKVHEQEMEQITTNDLKLKSFIEFCKCWEDHLFDFSTKIVLLEKLSFQDKMEPYFIINMLFSSLLDNDNMDAAELERPDRLSIDQNIIKSYIENNLLPTNEIDRLRNILFEHVDKQYIDLNIKRYTLTAATGLGKTLTSVNLALNIRKKIEEEKGYKPRIIYVAPFISILDQNMEVLQKVFSQKGNSNLLLMHHHLAPVNYHDNLTDEGYATFQSEFLTHGWNAEVIVTTFIQFFNMVFGRFTSQLRRLDNVIGSIVILDEVQSIPFQLWDIVREGLLFLSQKFNFTIILMTATQPLIFKEGETVEIANNITIKPRVSFVLRNDKQITLDNFCSDMHELISKYPTKNIMIEINTIWTAKEVFDSLSTIKTHQVRFLSSQVIPKHRRPRINEIKETLKPNNHKPIVLVTTQVVEAGVDLDFDQVVRDIGPIDSIVQAAGRCNRESKRNVEDSLFYVYRIVDDRRENRREFGRYIYDDVAIEIANDMLNTNNNNNNIDIQELVQRYYTEIRRRQSNQKSNEIYDYVSDLNYEETEKQFSILDEGMYKLPVFVEFDENATIVWEKYLALSNLEDKKTRRRRTAESIQLRNQMGEYMININDKDIVTLNLQHVGGIYKIDSRDCVALYDEEKGFVNLS